MERLEEMGVETAYSFESGKEIIDRITDGLTNDGRFSSFERMLEKSIDTVKKDQYQKWYNSFVPKVWENLEKYWGKPVGDFMAVEDQILVPGILNGNVFIGLQPPRGFRRKSRGDVSRYRYSLSPSVHRLLTTGWKRFLRQT